MADKALELELKGLKERGEAPEWMTNKGYSTISRGYRLKGETPKDMYARVAKSASDHLPKFLNNGQGFEQEFFGLLWNNILCPASPVLSNAGTDRGLTISCFGVEPADSLLSIMDKNKELAMLTKAGGGVGVNFNNIRQKGLPIKGGANGHADGIMSFAPIYDKTIVGVSQGSCYVDGTEVLTSEGFVDFKDITSNSILAQVDNKRNITFTKGEPTQQQYSGKIYTFRNDTMGYNLQVTDNHRMVIERLKSNKQWSGELVEVQAKDLKLHRDNKIHQSGIIEGESTISPFDRLRIAFQADGRKTDIRRDNEIYTISFKFKKRRKIERLLDIVEECGLIYDRYDNKDDSTRISIKVSPEDQVDLETLEWIDITKINTNTARDMLKEVAEWDGSWRCADKNSFIYSSIDNTNIKALERLCAIAGVRFKSHVADNREGNRKDLHCINIRLKYAGISGDCITTEVSDYEGMVYCCIVPEGRIIIKQNGFVSVCGNTRRGAASINLDIDHGDFHDFIKMRRPEGDVDRQCTNLHHCVQVSDNFMERLKDGDTEAQKRWGKLMIARFETGEPYIMFKDRVNELNPEGYKYNNLIVNMTNICSEITLFSDALHSYICCLSSLNLTKWDLIKDSNAVELSTLFLNGILNEFIQKGQHIEGLENVVRHAIKGRAIGLGVLGWHTLLQERSIPFDSFQSMQLNAQIFKHIKDESHRTSKEIARQSTEPEWCKGTGYYNSHLTAVAPTRSNSIISGGVSAGIEPWIRNVFADRTAKGTFIDKNPTLESLLESKGMNTSETWDEIIANEGSVRSLDFLSDLEKEVFLTAYEIDPMAIIRQASQRTPFIDQSQSLNIFVTGDVDPKYFSDLHIQAFDMGLKTMYYCRSERALKIGANQRAPTIEGDCASCEG